MRCAHGGVSGCGGAVRGSNVRKNEAEKMEKSEGVVFVSAGGSNAKLVQTQPKRELQTHFLDRAGAHKSGPAPRLATG